MHIIMILPSLKEKGPLIVATNIARFKSNSDIKFSFVSLRNNSCKDKQRFLEFGIDTYEIGMGKIPTVNTIYKLNKILKRLTPDIVHIHCFWPTILGALFYKKYKLITTLHNNPYEDYVFEYGKVAGKIMAEIMVRIVNIFQDAVAISEYVKNIYNNNKIKVVYNGVENYNIGENHFSCDRNNMNIISISVLNRRKNLETGLRTMKYIKERGIKFKYTIVGDGYLREELQQLAVSLGIMDNVYFLGKLNRKEIFDLLEKQEVLLFSSQSEGFGLVVIESMMKGVVVVCSDIPVMHEIIDDGVDGFLCSTFDEKTYGECLLKLRDRNLLQSVSILAQKKYRNKFTIESMVNKYNDIYIANYDIKG